MPLSMSRRAVCRVCGSAELREFLSFEGYPLSDNFLSRADLEAGAARREVIEDYAASFCVACATVQNLIDFDWSGYYGDYEYAVSSSAFAQKFMERVVDGVERLFGLGAGDRAVELGSSDGAQLAAFARRGYSVFGFEPSLGLAERARAQGVPTTTSLFGFDSLAEIPPEMLPLQVIASFYTFDHLPDPQRALEAMAEVLDRQRGVVLIEVHDLEQIVARREACLFCHEHTIYPGRRALARMFERAGLRLVSDSVVPEAERRGNSILVAAVHADNPRPAALEPDSAASRALDDWSTFAGFAAEVERAHAGLREHVRRARKQGRRVGGFGASARSISTLAIAGLGRDDVEVIYDNNAAVQGQFLPKTHVPIEDPARVMERELDEIIVFAYGYYAEIAEQLAAFTAAGGRLTSLLDLLR